MSVLSLLDMRGVTVELPTAAGWVKPVNDVSLGLVGGQFVECGPAGRILHDPTSPYTRELLAAVPEIPRAAKV